MIRVTCLGGAGTVTGSSYLIDSAAGKKILIDCGLFQGGRGMEERNWADWGFDPGQIDSLFLTHAHIDHCGRVPKLVRDGFRGRILTSGPTAELCKIMLEDAAHIQEMDADWQNRKNKRQARGETRPLYTMQDALAAQKLFHPIEQDAIIECEPGVKARLRNAGHILGSSILELWVEENGESMKIVFSGDLGRRNALIINDPYIVFDADYLFIESTYGNRLHRSFEDSKKEFLEAIRFAVSRDEKIIIPAFAVERTQEILYILGGFQRKKQLPEIPIYLDSPLAIKATAIFKKSMGEYDQDAMEIVNQGHSLFELSNLHPTEGTRESMAINERPGSAIVIAGNGMCTAGRIRHHLKHNLWREGASIVFVGFQAEGTTGRQIVDGAEQVRVLRENVAVRAKVFTIGGFSAHADQKELLDWARRFESSPRVFVVHGEPSASAKLSEILRMECGFEVYIPKWKERLILKPREMAVEAPPETEAEPDMPSLALGAILNLEKELHEIRRQIRSKEAGRLIREEDLDRLKYIREELQFLLADMKTKEK